MTRTHYRDVDLTKLVDLAKQILVVRHDEPSHRIVEETLGVPVGADAPPFAYRVQRYLVDSVIRGAEELAGQPIEVEPADLDGRRRSYTDYYGIGLSKHRIASRYRARGAECAAGFLVFLTFSEDRHRFCVNGAIESLEFVEEVRGLVR